MCGIAKFFFCYFSTYKYHVHFCRFLNCKHESGAIDIFDHKHNWWDKYYNGYTKHYGSCHNKLQRNNYDFGYDKQHTGLDYNSVGYHLAVDNKYWGFYKQHKCPNYYYIIYNSRYVNASSHDIAVSGS